MELRIRAWRAIHGEEQKVVFWQLPAPQTFQDLDRLDRVIQATVNDLNTERQSITCANRRIVA
ncbi:MAG: hypothetical protein HWD60_03870 [Defluviicoccus sp.]|nr:MAG: hypothetical protein HWD60_03870 [Defluviicoccus sp.]